MRKLLKRIFLKPIAKMRKKKWVNSPEYFGVERRSGIERRKGKETRATAFGNPIFLIKENGSGRTIEKGLERRRKQRRKK